MHRITVVPNDVANALDGFAKDETEKAAAEAAENNRAALDYVIEDETDDTSLEADYHMNIQLQDVEKVLNGMIKLQARIRGAQVRDDELLYDSESEPDEESIYDGVYNCQNSQSPTFYEAYPACELIHLTDDQFKRDVLMPFLRDKWFANPLGNGVQCDKGHVACDCICRCREDEDMVIVGMLKRAVYAYLAKELA